MGRKAHTLEWALDRYVGENRQQELCWIWTGPTNRSGAYVSAVVTLGGRRYSARRICYETFIGPVPPHESTRPACGISLCINPWHAVTTSTLASLEPVESLPIEVGEDVPPINDEVTPVSSDDVEAILNMLPPGDRTPELLASLGIDSSMIAQILSH